MRLIFVFAFLVISIKLSYSQEVLWATKVLEKSSETVDDSYSPKYRAVQILGRPNVLPQTISSPCSWRPTGSAFGEDYIKVSFEKALKVRQIIIGETVNPGAIGRIFGYTTNNEEVLLYENTNAVPKLSGRTWNVIIPETQSEISSIKILIVHQLNKGLKEYDAIGISASDVPYQAKINIADNIPKDLVRENLGSNINSRFGEVAPLVSPDGKSLYFTRLNHPENIKEKSGKNERIQEIKQDIWTSSLNKSKEWDQAVNVGEPLNNIYNNAASAISADGKSLYVLNVYLPNGKFVAGLSKSTLKNKKWEAPRQIKISDFQALEYYDEKIRANTTVTEYAISPDEKYLLMGLKRTESYGDKDIYVSFKTGDDSYSKPLNLGSIINSAANEGSPFLAADNKTLYFISNGHPSFGDADIYVSTRLDDTWTNWTLPINLGPIINSPEWDGYITIPASGEYAYFSSSRNSMGSDDIFKIKLFPTIKPQIVNLLEAQFKDRFTQKVIIPQLSITQVIDSKGKPNNESPVIAYDDDNMLFKTILTSGNKYILSAKLSGYGDLQFTVDLIKETGYKELKKNFELLPIAEGQKMILQNLLFDQSSAVIRDESFEELEKIKNLMLSNPTMEILLEGHTDNQGDMKKNIQLAEDRVKAVRDYIIKSGHILESRIKVKSWGPYKPLERNSSEEARKKNRRVEFTILKM